MLLVASVAFWMATDKQSAMMISASISLIGVGAYADLRHFLKDQVTPAIDDTNGATNGG